MFTIGFKSNIQKGLSKITTLQRVDALQPVMQASMAKIVAIYKQNSPGTRLKNSWLGKLLVAQAALQFTVRNTDPRAKWLLPILRKGAKPHAIQAIRAHVLKFQLKGGSGFLFRRSVHHPGVKPNLKLKQADIKTRAELILLKQAIRDAYINLAKKSTA